VFEIRKNKTLGNRRWDSKKSSINSWGLKKKKKQQIKYKYIEDNKIDWPISFLCLALK